MEIQKPQLPMTEQIDISSNKRIDIGSWGELLRYLGPMTLLVSLDQYASLKGIIHGPWVMYGVLLINYYIGYLLFVKISNRDPRIGQVDKLFRSKLMYSTGRPFAFAALIPFFLTAMSLLIPMMLWILWLAWQQFMLH